jgi:hypothetical protein
MLYIVVRYSSRNESSKKAEADVCVLKNNWKSGRFNSI